MVAASVSFSKPAATNVSIATFNLDLAIAGAVAVNVFDGNTRATLTRSDVTTTDGGNVALLATDDTDIEADGGGFAIAISLGENAKGGTRGSLSVAVGVSVAVNDVDNTVVAQIGDSRVNAAGDITVDADSTTSIKAVTIAGAISGSGPSGTATPSTNIQIAGAGAGSGNSVDNDIEASIVGSASTPAPAIQAGGGIRVEATDLSTIEADAGGVAIAFAVSKDSSMFSLALGLSAAKNDITNTVDAKITGSTVLAKGKLEGTGDGVLVRANSTSTIKALTLAGAGVSGGIAGSGAGSGNDIANDITSQISGSSNVEAQDGTLIVAAEDTATIKADAGALSIAITITSNNPNTVRLAAGIGITVAINDIENDVRAIVDGSVAKAKGNASVTAFSRPSIEVFSLSGTGGGSIDTGQSGGTLAVAFFGAGTGSGNEIDNIVEALVRNGATLESTDGTATVSATMPTPASGGATIVAKAVGVAVSVNVSNSNVNLSIAIGIAVAVNAIGQDASRGNIVRAKVTGATVKSKSGVSVASSATPAIDALAVGIGIAVQVQNGSSGTLSLSGAGTGAVSLNKIDTVVESLVESSSTVTASGGGVSVTATAPKPTTSPTPSSRPPLRPPWPSPWPPTRTSTCPSRSASPTRRTRSARRPRTGTRCGRRSTRAPSRQRARSM